MSIRGNRSNKLLRYFHSCSRRSLVESVSDYLCFVTKTLGVNKIALKSFSKSRRSESRLNCIYRHSYLKLTHPTKVV